MQKNKGRLKIFMTVFFTIMLMIALISTMIVALSRMENTMAEDEYIILKVDQNTENNLNVIILNKEYECDFTQTSKIVDHISTYNVIIPAEIRLFLYGVKSTVNAAKQAVYSIL